MSRSTFEPELGSTSVRTTSWPVRGSPFGFEPANGDATFVSPRQLRVFAQDYAI